MFSVANAGEIVTFAINGNDVSISRAGSRSYFGKVVDIKDARFIYRALLSIGYAPYKGAGEGGKFLPFFLFSTGLVVAI